MKKRTYFWVITILFLLSIITFSCDSYKLKHFVDEETKSYCYFENGINYVYLDSITEVIDTLYLNEKWDITTKGTPKIGGQIISSSSVTEIDVENSFMRIACETTDPFDSSAESYSWAEFKGDNWDFSAFYLSNNNDIPMYYYDINLEILETFTTYQLEDNTFYDVKKVKSENTTLSEYSYSYWAKNVGLIKYERYEEDSLVNNITLISYEF